MSLGGPVLCWLMLTQTCLGRCVVPQPALHVSYSNTIVLLQWHVNIVGDALTEGQGYRLSTIMDSLLFHVSLWISYIHRSIEYRVYCPCYQTDYLGFSVQAHFLNSVSAVLE